MALSSFAGADASTDNQKVALLSNIAQQGSAGAESYKAQAAVLANVRQDAVKQMSAVTQGNGNNAPGAYQAQLGAQMAGPADNYAANNASAAMSFAQDVGRIGAASGSYMDAVKGARPIVESVTSRAVEQTLAELAAKREAMAAEAQARKDAAAARAEDRAWAREDRDYERAQRGAGDSLDQQKLALAQAELDQRKFEFLNGKGGKPPDDVGLDPLIAGRPLGMDSKRVGEVMASRGYQRLRGLTNQIMDDPAMTKLGLEKALEYTEASLRGQKDKNGNEILPIGSNYPAARALILNEMSPFFGGASALSKSENPYQYVAALRGPPRFNPHSR